MITQITDKEIAQAATIEALRHEITAWSVTAENLEAERDALKADAEQWRAYKKRKNEVIAAGMARSPLRSEAPDTYAVISKEGNLEYSASWPEACHDHIKEMQETLGLGYVVGWKVRGVKILQTYKDAAMKEANHG